MEFLHRLGKLSGLISLLFVLGYTTAAQTPPPTPSPTPRLSASPLKLGFGDHDIETTSTQSVTLKNNGTLPLRLYVRISSNDVDFAVAKLAQDSLAPGAEVQVYVKFTPTHADSRIGKLEVSYEPADKSTPPANQNVELEGKGSIPTLRLSASQLNFGFELTGSTGQSQSLTLTAGKEAVNVLVNTTISDFTVNPLNCSLPANASCNLSVTFAPKRVGEREGYLAIITDRTAIKQVRLEGEGTQGCRTATDPLTLGDAFRSQWPVLLIVLIYLVALIFVRWNMIARPTRNLLIAEIGAVRQRVEMLRQQPNPPVVLAQITELLHQAAILVTDQPQESWLLSLRQRLGHVLDHLFWTRGQELAAWGYVHEAEEQLVFFLPEQSVRAELERVEGDLRTAATPTAVGLADRIKEALAATPDDPSREALEDVLKFLQPQDLKLRIEVSKALKQAAALTLDQWRELAQNLLTYLTPQAASLAEKINQILAAPAPTAPQMTVLLQEVAKLLESNGLKLAAKLKDAFTAENASPPSPLKAADWQVSIEEANEYLSSQGSLIPKVQLALAARPEVPLERWRALHSEALGYLYNRSDNEFAQLIGWQNKTVWLVGCSLLLIVALAATLQHALLFLVGALGGLLSRLMRSLSRGDVPTDYGASWSTLFLSPVVGALAGWSGILLVIVGVEFNILGSALKFDWCNTYNPVMLGLALLLGFSERLFDGILDQLDRKVSEPPATSPPSPPPPPIAIVSAPVLAEGKVSQPYSQALKASGGTLPYKWTLAAGALPAGLKLDPGGLINGTPTATGTTKFTLQVSDGTMKSQTSEFTIVIT